MLTSLKDFHQLFRLTKSLQTVIQDQRLERLLKSMIILGCYMQEQENLIARSAEMKFRVSHLNK